MHESGAPERERKCTASIQPAWLMRTDLCSCQEVNSAHAACTAPVRTDVSVSLTSEPNCFNSFRMQRNPWTGCAAHCTGFGSQYLTVTGMHPPGPVCKFALCCEHGTCFRLLRASRVYSCSTSSKGLSDLDQQPSGKWPRNDDRFVLMSQAACIGRGENVSLFLTLSCFTIKCLLQHSNLPLAALEADAVLGLRHNGLVHCCLSQPSGSVDALGN